MNVYCNENGRRHTERKNQSPVDAMLDICAEDEYNDTYGRIRIHQALELKQPDDLMKRNFKSEKPLEKCVTDMTEVKCLDGRLNNSTISSSNLLIPCHCLPVVISSLPHQNPM